MASIVRRQKTPARRAHKTKSKDGVEATAMPPDAAAEGRRGPARPATKDKDGNRRRSLRFPFSPPQDRNDDQQVPCRQEDGAPTQKILVSSNNEWTDGTLQRWMDGKQNTYDGERPITSEAA
jgi:hypothetical protein